MKNTVLALAAVLLFSWVPAFGQDAPGDKYKCEVQAGTCLKRADTVQRKMKKLESDVKKGKTYSAEELKKIEDKLREVEQMLDNLKAK